MRKLCIPLIVLTALLVGCTQSPTPEAAHTLTVSVEGVPAAPVKVTNTATDAVVFDGMLSGSKAFAGQKVGTVLRVEGQGVNSYVTPAVQEVTLDSDRKVSLQYKKAPLTSVGGKVRLSLGVAPYQFPDEAARGETLYLFGRDSQGNVMPRASVKVASDLSVQIKLPTTEQMTPSLRKVGDLFSDVPADCTADQNTISDPEALVSDLSGPVATFFEMDSRGLTISGRLSLRLQASTADATPLELIYADRPVDVSLLVKCPFPDSKNPVFTSTIQWKLKTGWNLLKDLSDQYVAQTFTLVSIEVDTQNLLFVPNGYPPRTGNF